MIMMKRSASCVIFLSGSSISQRSRGAKQSQDAVRLLHCLAPKNGSHCWCVCASFVRHTPLCTRVDKWVTDVSIETDSKWWKMCLQQFSELFSWERGPFSALEVIALSIKNLNWIWNFRQTLCEYTKPGPYSRSALSSTSAWRHRLQS